MDEEALKKIEEHKKKAEEHIAICVKENEIVAEIAKKLTLGDFTIRDEKAKVRLTKKLIQLQLI